VGIYFADGGLNSGMVGKVCSNSLGVRVGRKSG